MIVACPSCGFKLRNLVQLNRDPSDHRTMAWSAHHKGDEVEKSALAEIVFRLWVATDEWIMEQRL